MLHIFLYSTSPKPPIVPGMALLSLVSLGLNLLGLLGLAYALLVEPGEDPRLAGDKLIFRFDRTRSLRSWLRVDRTANRAANEVTG